MRIEFLLWIASGIAAVISALAIAKIYLLHPDPLSAFLATACGSYFVMVLILRRFGSPWGFGVSFLLGVLSSYYTQGATTVTDLTNKNPITNNQIGKEILRCIAEENFGCVEK